MKINYYPNDYGINKTRLKQTEDLLYAKYLIAGAWAPSVIIEIGVRAGYTAQALLQASPHSTYYGFDCNNGSYGGASDTRFTDFAKEQLKQYNAIIDDKFNSQLAKELPITGFNLAHVDADHSAVGCYNDLELCFGKMNRESIILIDDYDMDTVRAGVKTFLTKHGELELFKVPYTPEVLNKLVIIMHKDNKDGINNYMKLQKTSLKLMR